MMSKAGRVSLYRSSPIARRCLWVGMALSADWMRPSRSVHVMRSPQAGQGRYLSHTEMNATDEGFAGRTDFMPLPICP